MRSRIEGIRDVAERQLCCGCGACAYVQPEAIRMVDVLDQGRRPMVSANLALAGGTDEALQVCPGIELSHHFDRSEERWIADLVDGWGPVLEVWEGYAGDPSVRFGGSSGGAATALALHCLQDENMYGVLHVAARSDVPYLNQTVLSRSREELLAATGSRYAPASPCDGLQLVEEAPKPCVFIGKPCDVAAASKARALRPVLDQKLGLTIAFFCAGTPSTEGTLEMIRSMGVKDPDEIDQVRYRGNGWPGMAEVKVTIGRRQHTHQLSYDQSWNRILQKHRPWRCHVCADHTGEFADVAVGDPWYRPVTPGDPGRSLVLVRTERGRELLNAARRSGALILERADPALLPASQMNLIQTRGAVWGRIVTCRAMGIATPRFCNMPTFLAWRRELTVRQKAQSVYGTLKRIFTRRLYQRRPSSPFSGPRFRHTLPNAGQHAPAEPQNAAPSSQSPISVVIPASNEGSVIGRTLATLLSDAVPGEFEVVVVCNGCTDNTAAVAREFTPMVQVIETPVRSKAHALNLGDDAVSGFPRLYVDADVQLGTRDIRNLVGALASGRALAASPRLEMDVSASTWAVRSFHQIWLRLPNIRNGLVGRGVYCVSEEGRARFGAFPDVIADDLFMHMAFEPSTRISVDTCTSVVEAPRSLRGLLERKTRSFAGNRQLRAGATTLASVDADPTAWLRVLAAHPQLVQHAPVYVFVTLIGKMRGRAKLRRGDAGTWNRDETTRRRLQHSKFGSENRPN